MTAPATTRRGGEFAWHPNRACADVDPELFFPYSDHSAEADHAKQVCRSCPVLVECAAWALEHLPKFGIWGAMSPSDMRRVRRRGVWQ